jgi:uncharacterized protein YbjT (DUF2867 family)
MTAPERPVHVVFGATGAVVAELVRRGERIRAISRRGQASHVAKGVSADTADPAGAAATP